MITTDERKRLIGLALEREQWATPVCFWISFCNTDRPKGQQFLGVVITRAKGIVHAIQYLHAIGVNPGGQVMADEIDDNDIDPSHFDKLLTKADLVAAGYCDA